MIFVKLKKYFLLSIIPLVCIIFLLYISYHSYISDSGYAKNTKLHAELITFEKDLQILELKKNKLKHHLYLLESVDADMLQEQAKRILYYAHPDEIIIQQ